MCSFSWMMFLSQSCIFYYYYQYYLCTYLISLVIIIDSGVTIVIPAGAIAEGVKQEVYFKVCQDNSIMPPLDKDKGTLLYSRNCA